jgi:hypothetical protein
MRIFIGFKYQAGDGAQRTVPVAYGDMTRQVASIIRENSENKMPTVPRVACYITGLELDTSRLADATFVSKMNIRERDYSLDDTGNPVYGTYQGSGYTVERLMPTPFKLKMKADIWTSNTDQKLQLLEQILVLFNPSLEIQTTDNYIDWTSLSVIDLSSITFSSRSIPQGTETDIDICTMEFEMPIYITPPAKVKKLGIVKAVMANVFAENGDVSSGLNDLIFNQDVVIDPLRLIVTINNYDLLLLKGPTGTGTYDYYLSITDVTTDTWETILELNGGITPTSLIHFMQPTGYEITGTFEINELNKQILVVTLDPDTIPTNNITPVNRIVDPYNFNPITFYGGTDNIPVNTRLLVLDNINDPTIARVGADDAWVNLDSAYPYIKANSIIEWTGTYWAVDFDPDINDSTTHYVQNLTSMVQYRWDGEQWVKSFEGDYKPGTWRIQSN